MTQSDEPTQQAVGYCRHQASKGIDSLVALMERTKNDWLQCLDGMSEGQAGFAPAGEWSSRQVVNHFLDVTTGVNCQIEQLTAGGDIGSLDEASPQFTGNVPEATTTAQMRDTLSHTFDDITALTRALDGNQHLDRRFPHPMFGQLNILEWIAFQRLHGMDHMQQIEKNKADPAYPKA